MREQIHAGSDVIKLMATGGVMTPGVNPEDAHYTEEELRVGVDEGHRFNRTCASHAQGSAGILNAVRAGMDSIGTRNFHDAGMPGSHVGKRHLSSSYTSCSQQYLHQSGQRNSGFYVEKTFVYGNDIISR